MCHDTQYYFACTCPDGTFLQECVRREGPGHRIRRVSDYDEQICWRCLRARWDWDWESGEGVMEEVGDVAGSRGGF